MVVVILLFMLIGMEVFLLIKNENTFRNHTIIIDAIYSYKQNCIKNSEIPLVDYSETADYDMTLYRLWDWGYERILPPEKYEIIKPYIGGENHAA